MKQSTKARLSAAMKKSWKQRQLAKTDSTKLLPVNSFQAVVTNDPINSPLHYTKGVFETIVVIEDIIQHYTDPVEAALVAQTLRYLARAPLKNAYRKDIKKAQWYLNRLVSRDE